MPSLYIVVFILVVSFTASLIRSTFGFGESLVGVPLFLLLLPVHVAVPLSVMLSVVIAAIVIVQDYKKIHFHSAKWLILYALPGIPLGMVMLIYGNALLVKIILGLLIIGYSLYTLFRKRTKALPKDSKLLLVVCGFLSGVFGGAYGLNGPPLVIYGNMQRWTAKHFRATLQAYFLPVGLISLMGYAAKGLVTSNVYTYFFIALFASIPAIFLGRYLNHLLKDRSFFKYIYWGLIIIGITLIVSSIV